MRNCRAHMIPADRGVRAAFADPTTGQRSFTKEHQRCHHAKARLGADTSTFTVSYP